MVSLESELKDKRESVAENLGRYLVVRMKELTDKTVGAKKKSSQFERDMLMVLSYTLFGLSGS